MSKKFAWSLYLLLGNLFPGITTLTVGAVTVATTGGTMIATNSGSIALEQPRPPQVVPHFENLPFLVKKLSNLVQNVPVSDKSNVILDKLEKMLNLLEHFQPEQANNVRKSMLSSRLKANFFELAALIQPGCLNHHKNKLFRRHFWHCADFAAKTLGWPVTTARDLKRMALRGYVGNLLTNKLWGGLWVHIDRMNKLSALISTLSAVSVIIFGVGIFTRLAGIGSSWANFIGGEAPRTPDVSPATVAESPIGGEIARVSHLTVRQGVVTIPGVTI